MKIACFFIGWNIEETVHLTVNHYKAFCEKVIYLDNHSTDGSWNAALRAGAECRLFGIPGVLDDGEYVKVKNNVWKEFRDYDYVIVLDDDEILYHRDLEWNLEMEQSMGATIFKTQGFSIYTKYVPQDSWLEFQNGVRDDNYSKTVIFDPKAIQEIGFVYGCHQAKPTGNLRWGLMTIPLLHYHNIGGIERVIARHRAYEPRRQKSPLNMRWGLGHHYAAEHEAETRRHFEECLKNSVPLSEAGLY